MLSLFIYRKVTEADKASIQNEAVNSFLLSNSGVSDHWTTLEGCFEVDAANAGHLSFPPKALPGFFQRPCSRGIVQGFVMNYANGGKASKMFISSTPIDPDLAKKIGFQLLWALYEGKSTLGFSHGDLKWDNVLLHHLEETGLFQYVVGSEVYELTLKTRVQIVDNGSSRVGVSGEEPLDIDHFNTTYQYMAPFHFFYANSSVVGYWHDGFAFGKMLCELYLGQLMDDMMDDTVVCPDVLMQQLLTVIESSENYSIFASVKKDLDQRPDGDELLHTLLNTLYQSLVLFGPPELTADPGFAPCQREILEIVTQFCSENKRYRLDHKRSKLEILLPGLEHFHLREMIRGVAHWDQNLRWSFERLLKSPFWNDLISNGESDNQKVFRKYQIA